MNWIEELQEKYPIEDKEVVFQKPPELDPTKPTKVIVPQNGGASTTEKGLHNCPLCGGYNFILSIAGGYFCEVCQPGHEGQKVIAGSTLPRPLKMDKAIPKKRGSVSRPPKKKTSATIIPLKRGSFLALQWIEAHKDKLEAAGFTYNDLYNQSLPIGVAHLKVWFKENLSVELKDNTIIFSWKNRAGKTITQTSQPEEKFNTTQRGLHHGK